MRPVLIALALVACRPAVHVVDPVPTIPVSYEVNLVTARECKFRGVVVGDRETRALGANLLVAFKYSRSEITTNGIRSVAYGAVHGKAVECPDEVLQRLLRKEQP
jgi:hypothetical protein